MTKIFISHSSEDNAYCIAVRDWLVSKGFDDIFVDLESIQVGARWRKALSQNMNRCRVVIFLVSKSWLASEECRLEYALARDAQVEKKLIFLSIDDTHVNSMPREYTTNYQVRSLVSGVEHITRFVQSPPSYQKQKISLASEGLATLQKSLLEIGLGSATTESFPWPPDSDPVRSPYRGLTALDELDAGILFGRDADIQRGMNEVDRLREQGGRKAVAILGVSGAGKSSFLRAGLIPRLKRSELNYQVLPTLRASRGALFDEHSGLLAVVHSALKSNGVAITRSEVRSAIEMGAPEVLKLLEKIREQAASGLPPDARKPTLIFPIDQAEELHSIDGGLKNESDRFIQLLADLLAHGPETIALLTLRTDRYEPFQTEAAIPQSTFILLPMNPLGYKDVILNPAKRLTGNDRSLEIEPALVDIILRDTGGDDALPIIAFTLERQFQEFGDSGKLTIDQYNKIGGINGSIVRTLNSAFADPQTQPPIETDELKRNELLKSAFIPHLIDIAEDNDEPARKVAELSKLPENTHTLIERMVNHRLLTSTADLESTSRVYIEVAHEALLRHWPLANSWFEDEKASLRALREVKRAGREWHTNVSIGEQTDIWIVHRGERLERTKQLLGDDRFANSLSEPEKQYLIACEDVAQDDKSQKEALERSKHIARRLTVSFIALALFASASVVMFSLWSAARESRSRVQDVLWENLVSRWDRAVSPTIWEAEGVTNASIDSTDVRAQIGLYILDTGKIDADDTSGLDLDVGAKLEVKLRDFRVASEALEPIFETQFAVYDGRPAEVDGVTVSHDGKYVAAGDDAGHIVVWDATNGYAEGEIKLLHRFMAHSDQVGQVRFHPKRYDLLSVGFDGKAKVWNAETRELLHEYDAPGRNWGSAWSPDEGHLIAAGASEGTARVFDLRRPNRKLPVFEVDSRSQLAMGVAFNPDASLLAVAPVKEGIQIYDIFSVDDVPVGQAKVPRQVEEVGEGELFSVEWSRDGKLIASGLDNGTVLVWETEGAQSEISRMPNIQGVRGLAFRQDNAYLATGSDAGEARVWSLPEGDLIAELRGHSDDVDSITWTPDNQYIVTGTDDGFLRVFRFEAPDFSQPISRVIDQTKQRFIIASAGGNTAGGENICLSPEQWKRLVGATSAPDWCRSSSQRIEDVIERLGREPLAEAEADLRQLVSEASVDQVFDRLAEAVSLTQLRVSGKNNRMRIAARYIELAKPLVSNEMSERAARLAFLEQTTQETVSQDQDTIARLAMESLSVAHFASGEEIAARADVASLFANEPNPISPDELGDENMRGQILSLSTDALFANLTVAANDGVIFLWDLATRTRETLVASDSGTVVYDVAINPAGTLVAAALSTGQFILIDLTNDQVVSQVGDSVRDPRSIGWSRNGQVLATGGDEEIARVWQMDGNQVADTPPVELIGHTGGIQSIALSHDGKYVITGSNDATARFWNARTGTSIFAIDHKGAIEAVDYSVHRDDHSALIAVGGADNVVELWRVTENGDVTEQISQLSFASNVQDVAFSGDGRYLAIASSSVSVWDVDSGKRRLTLDIEDITALTWASDGTELITGSRTGQVRKFNFDPDTLEARARDWINGCFTAEQRRDFELSDAAPDWCSEIDP